MTPNELYNFLSKLLDLAIGLLAILGVWWKYSSNRSLISLTDFMKALDHQIKENEKLIVENTRLKLETEIWKKHHEQATKR